MDGNAIAIAIVGGTRSGKSTWVKERLKKTPQKNIIVYDVNNEYTDFYNQTFIEDIDQFLEFVNKQTHKVVVFEEASIFFSSKGASIKLKKLLVKKRHIDITMFFVFHSVRMIPRDIFEMINYIFVKKTSDSADFIFQKYKDPRLYNVIKEVQISKDPYITKSIKLN